MAAPSQSHDKHRGRMHAALVVSTSDTLPILIGSFDGARFRQRFSQLPVEIVRMIIEPAIREALERDLVPSTYGPQVSSIVRRNPTSSPTSTGVETQNQPALLHCRVSDTFAHTAKIATAFAMMGRGTRLEISAILKREYTHWSRIHTVRDAHYRNAMRRTHLEDKVFYPRLQTLSTTASTTHALLREHQRRKLDEWYMVILDGAIILPELEMSSLGIITDLLHGPIQGFILRALHDRSFKEITWDLSDNPLCWPDYKQYASTIESLLGELQGLDGDETP